MNVPERLAQIGTGTMETPQVALERVVDCTEFVERTEVEAVAGSWTKALANAVRNISGSLFGRELLVDHPNSRMGRK